MWQVSTGVQKQVLKNQGTLKLSLNDVFYSQKFSATVKYQDIDVKIRGIQDSRRGTLTFTYRFGKPIQNQPKKKSSGLDEESRVKS